jgi:hypothetical protein
MEFNIGLYCSIKCKKQGECQIVEFIGCLICEPLLRQLAEEGFSLPNLPNNAFFFLPIPCFLPKNVRLLGMNGDLWEKNGRLLGKNA